MNKLTFFKALNSPFKPFKLKFYCGKISRGTPYFFPRRWVKLSKEEILDKAQEKYDKCSTKDKVSLQKFIDYYKNHEKPVSKIIGFDFVGLGWKTKWHSTDYRFEHSPIWSFVFIKWQFVIMFIAPEKDHYWEAWLYYHYNTDKSKSKRERITECRKHFPLEWKTWKKDPKTGETTSTEIIDYYNKILKSKYLK